MTSNFSEKSFWLETAACALNPPLTEDIEVDIAVVGGGFTGLSSAYHLKRDDPGLCVALLNLGDRLND